MHVVQFADTPQLIVWIETYSYLSFPERVFTTYEFLVEVLLCVSERGHDVVQVVESSQRPPERVAIRYRLDAFPNQ